MGRSSIAIASFGSFDPVIIFVTVSIAPLQPAMISFIALFNLAAYAAARVLCTLLRIMTVLCVVGSDLSFIFV